VVVLGVSESLERLWGIESRLYDFRRPRGVVERPRGFRVLEPRISIPRGGGWSWFYVYKVGLDSMRVLKLLSKALEAPGGLLGLKDACSHSFQYMAFRVKARVTMVNGGLFRAWLVGYGGAPRLGLHGYNIFRINVVLHGDVGGVEGVEWIPGYYGPQRFGIDRPNTHYLGLLFSEGRLGEVLNEYGFRYPMEYRRGVGYYERVAI